MASKDITERINAVDPDKINWSDPNAYAAMGIGEEDPDESNDTQGDTAGAAPAPAAAATPAQAAPAVAAAPASAPAASSATPGAAGTDANGEPDRPQGVATRDGKHVIPYEVLSNTRDHARRVEQENADLRQQLEQLAAQASGKGGTAPNADQQDRAAQGLLTEEERVDFPALAKIEQAFVRLNTQLSQAAAAPAANPAATAPAAARPSPQDEDAEFDMAIAANPLIAKWMGEKGPEWKRATALDRMLRDDPTTSNLSYAERFARVQRSVAAEFGVSLPSTPAPAAAAAPAAAPATAPAVRQAPMPSLSDMGGTAPQSTEDAVNSATAVDLLASAERMSDAELMRFAGIGY